MTLDIDYQSTLAKLPAQSSFSKEELIACIDLTLLDKTASPNDLKLLSTKGNRHHVAALCVFPEHLKYLESNNGPMLATVVNFPEGNQPIDQVLKTINQLVDEGKANEVDYVFPYQAYLAGEESSALLHCEQCYTLCNQHGFLFKVILETGALPSLDHIYKISSEVIKRGCDFLKTSTGKINQGATPTAVFSILRAIQDGGVSCGLKVSGGVRKPGEAFSYMELAKAMLATKIDKSCFRIGASSLLDELTA